MLGRALHRVWRAFILVISLGFVKISEKVEKSAKGIEMRYDEKIQGKKNRLNRLLEAQAKQKALFKRKGRMLKEAKQEQADLNLDVDGAQQLFLDEVNALREKNISEEDILENPEVLCLQGEYADYKSSRERIIVEIKQHQEDFDKIEQDLKDDQLEIQQILRDIDKLEQEAIRAGMAVQIAKEKQEMAAIKAGIAEDETGDSLDDIRKDVDEIVSLAEVTEEASGTTAKKRRLKARHAAKHRSSTNELLQLAGLGQKKDEAETTKPVKEAVTDNRLPE